MDGAPRFCLTSEAPVFFACLKCGTLGFVLILGGMAQAGSATVYEEIESEIEFETGSGDHGGG
jgi:hypothetical protein